MNRRILIIAVALIMVIALVGCTQQPSQPTPVAVVDETGNVQNAIPTVTVSGKGEIEVEPDMVTMQFGVELTQQNDAKQAVENVGKAMDALIEALVKAGVKEEDIQTSSYSIYTSYKYDNNGNAIGKPMYNISNFVTVKLYEVEKAAAVIDAAVDAGATNTYGITFGLKDQNAHELAALELALENARGRADALASASDKKVVDVLLINDGTQITEQVYANDVPERAYSMADTGGGYSGGSTISGGKITIIANVSARFTLS